MITKLHSVDSETLSIEEGIGDTEISLGEGNRKDLIVSSGYSGNGSGMIKKSGKIGLR